MTKAANDYYDAHGYPTDNHENKDKRVSTNKPFNQHKLSNGHNNLHLQLHYTVIIVALTITTPVIAENQD